MNTKHTPGPWNLHKHYTGEPLAVDGGDNSESFVAWTYCVANGELILADVVGYSHGRSSGCGFGRADKRSEVEANARLIAAAPELLEALEAAYYVLMDKQLDAECDIYKRTARQKARAAIAKATGETI